MALVAVALVLIPSEESCEDWPSPALCLVCLLYSYQSANQGLHPVPSQILAKSCKFLVLPRSTHYDHHEYYKYYDHTYICFFIKCRPRLAISETDTSPAPRLAPSVEEIASIDRYTDSLASILRPGLDLTTESIQAVAW